MRLPPVNTKTRGVFDALMTGRSYNLFEATPELHDRCLHSTVSTLQNDYGIKVSRLYETVPGYKGNPTRCCRYWIDPEERQRIKEKALTTSDQTIGEGLSNNMEDNNASGDGEQYDKAS